MAIPTSKYELLEAIDSTFDKLMSDLERVPLDRTRFTSMDGHARGTKMSPADLVAYLVGWNELVLKWLEKDDLGEKVDFPETGFKWNQLGLLAQKFYAEFSMLSWSDLLGRFAKAKTRLVETISERSDNELYGRSWYGKHTKGRLIQLNTSSPYANARKRIRSWLKTVT